MAKPKYEIKLDLRVLDHLGINLYSNAAAVLSEAVANCWDADASEVRIVIEDGEISIRDDGSGMNLRDINKRFLNVGYDKREEEGDTSPKGRSFMGRKGIGKLALFSIADTIEVCTARAGEKHAFRMSAKALKSAIKKKRAYEPEVLKPPARFTKGTKIVLSDLKKKRTSHTVTALRKRIARRFSIIGQTGGGDSFDVFINEEAVGPKDRDDLKAIEFLWEFGAKHVVKKGDCPALKKRALIPGLVSEEHPDWVVRGWFGAAAKPKELRNDESGTMHGLVVLARGRLIQENILDKLNFSRILTSYLTGQIEANFLDVKGKDDIATSDRQRLMEDDERYVALVAFLRNTLVAVSDSWTEHRNEIRGKEAVEENPVLQEWIETLPEGQQKAASRMFGIIQGVELEEDGERQDLYRAGMVAFERLRLKEESHRLGEEGFITAETLLPLLSDLSSLEASLYRDIVKARLDVIRKFESLVDGNAKERVLQEHLFKNLWLLDAGWDRAAESQRIEQALKSDFDAFDPKLTEEESKGRVDIRYRTNARTHIIVELKKSDRQMKVDELSAQGRKYLTALRKCLKASGEENPNIEIVFVLGRPVAEEEEAALERDHVKNQLANVKGRVVYYDQLIQGARQSYGEYLDQSAKADKLDVFLKRLAKAQRKLESKAA